MAELIDREKNRESACRGCIYRICVDGCSYPEPCEKLLAAFLTAEPVADVAPVVRCQDCRNHSDADGYHYCKFWRMYCPDDAEFFCKAGKMR